MVLYERFKNRTPPGYSCEYDGGVAIPLKPDSSELMEAIELANALYGAPPTLMMKVYYSTQEINAAEYLHMSVSLPLESEGKIPRDYGTKCVDSCPVCGRGGQLETAVLVDRKFIKNSKIGELSPHYFVSEETRKVIENAGLTGVTFEREVLDYKGREMVKKYYVMNISHILPPLSTTTWLEPGSLHGRSCGHRITYLRSDLQYEKEKLNDAPDFNLTEEYLNNGESRQLVVSARARKVLLANKVRWVHYEPILLL